MNDRPTRWRALRTTTILLTAAGLCLQAGMVRARNVDLSTVPARGSVQLTIYNSEDLTLVRETRAVSFKRGINRLQFSWANTLIDPTSVEMRFKEHSERLVVLDATYPHDKPQMLYWNVESEYEGQATVEITYFTSGITWGADYVMVAGRAERIGSLEGFVKVRNRSGEDYPDAQVRLVVGTINLVEKIAQLARVPMGQVRSLEESVRRDLRFRAAKSMMAGDSAASEPAAEKAIIKEGLSEYFIYTVEGTETIPHGWSKRLRSFHAEAVPLRVRYRYRPREYGERLTRVYLLENDERSGLGSTPLPDGAVRIFRRNGGEGLSFLASQRISYVPIGDRVALNLGHDPRVVFELVKLKSYRDDLWLRLGSTGVYRRVRDARIDLVMGGRVVGWDEHAVYSQRIRNYSPNPIEVEVRRSFEGDAIFRSRLGAKRYDYHTVQFEAHVPAGESADLLYEVLTHHGHNAEQNRVTVEQADIRRPVY